jgi:hypothetical protein
MTRRFGKLPAAVVAMLVAASFVMPLDVEAAAAGGRGGAGGGGGGGRAEAGGGGARASAGAQTSGGARQNAQVNNAKADARTNNVRSTSVNNVNNVNVDRNVNVNVSGNNNGCCNNGWDNDYHPVATAAAISATAAIVGSMVRTVPPGCVPVNYGGMVYQQCGSTWYAPQGSQFTVVNPPY